MSNPFQSIIGLSTHSEPDLTGFVRPGSDEGALLGDRTQASRPDACAISTRIETGLCEAAGDIKEAGPRAMPLRKRAPLRGGVYEPHRALVLINSHFFVGKNDQEIGIFRINEDGSASFVPPDQFKLEIQNMFVLSGGAPKAAEKYWREHPDRRQRNIVFKPGVTTGPDEYNLWRGFGVEPRSGWQQQRRLIGAARGPAASGALG